MFVLGVNCCCLYYFTNQATTMVLQYFLLIYFDSNNKSLWNDNIYRLFTSYFSGIISVDGLY